MATLDLAPVEHQVLTVRVAAGELRGRLDLKLRVFSLEDAYWVERLAKKKYKLEDGDWFKEIFGGNVEMALDVLAHQLENEEDLAPLLGGRELRDGLGRVVMARPRCYEAIAVALVDLHQRGQPEVRLKKSLAARLRLVLTALLAAYCIGAGAYLAWTWLPF